MAIKSGCKAEPTLAAPLILQLPKLWQLQCLLENIKSQMLSSVRADEFYFDSTLLLRKHVSKKELKLFQHNLFHS